VSLNPVAQNTLISELFRHFDHFHGKFNVLCPRNRPSPLWVDPLRAGARGHTKTPHKLFACVHARRGSTRGRPQIGGSITTCNSTITISKNQLQITTAPWFSPSPSGKISGCRSSPRGGSKIRRRSITTTTTKGRCSKPPHRRISLSPLQLPTTHPSITQDWTVSLLIQCGGQLHFSHVKMENCVHFSHVNIFPWWLTVPCPPY
jgi:hypothetical protein